MLADAWGNIIDEVTYADTLPWPVSADGHGDFLILIDPDLDNALPESWMAADNFVGIPERPHSPTLTVSPNPTTGVVRITSDKPMTSVTVTDAQGRVMSNETASDITTIDLNAYPSGIYLVKALTCDGITRLAKVIKK